VGRVGGLRGQREQGGRDTEEESEDSRGMELTERGRKEPSWRKSYKQRKMK
jgi:hypothetical protein